MATKKASHSTDSFDAAVDNGSTVTRPPSQGLTPSETLIPSLSRQSGPSGAAAAPPLVPYYIAQIFGDLYAQDGLAVLGQGLQWMTLLASLVRFYADVEQGHAAIQREQQEDEKAKETIKRKDTVVPKEKSSPTSKTTTTAAAPLKPPLVLILGLTSSDRTTLCSILESWGTPPSLLPAMITNESGLAKDRAALYQQGGVIGITSRILIVDLLNHTLPAQDIDGLLVTHAHQVTEQSTEAFIIRILTSQKQPWGSAFIKAITDAPEALLSGFAQVDKILKALYVRQLYLYPRFHHLIKQELEETPSHGDMDADPPSTAEAAAAQPAIAVIELQQPLSPLQKDMQLALAAAVKGCLRELQSATPLVEWSGADLSLENCATPQFDGAIRRQLERDWHRLSPQSKQLVQDLRTLRTLFQRLIQYDAVSFWKLLHSLHTISAASKHASLWLLTPAADLLFRQAKARVYQIHRIAPTKAVPHPVSRLEAVLEENPKWKLVRSVLEEVRIEFESERERRRQQSPPEIDGTGPTHVLVVAKDDRTVDTLREYLVDGERVLLRRWLRYLEQYNDKSRSTTNSTGGTAALSEESRLLLEEEGRVRRVLFGTGADTSKRRRKRGAAEKTALNQVPSYIKKQRRVAVEQSRGKLHQLGDDLERQAILDEAIETTEHFQKSVVEVRKRLDSDDIGPEDAEETKPADGEMDEDTAFKVSLDDELRVVIKSYENIQGDDASLLLQELRPKYIVLYDAEISFVRSVEVYASLRSRGNCCDIDGQPIKVYFLMYEASAEEKNFMKSLQREQNAFERLIHHKKTMPPPVLQSTSSQEMQHALEQGSVDSTYMNGSLPLAFDTRRGRGQLNTSKERRNIAVDVREFRSSLPSVLHQGGMRLAPVTLTVGDFVLSKVHCVERKSISDLYGSFTSGRLYNQVEAMSKHYKVPILLIEFDPNKSFCLHSSGDLGVEIRMDSIWSKLALLTMHFPILRIIWSKSPHETLRIFRELKTNHDEVDVDKAVEVGRSDAEDALLQPEPDPNGETPDEVNETARDVLLRLPGVNVHSARKIMQECESLAELSSMSRDELRRIAGPVTGQKLFTFFHQTLAT